MCSCVVAIRKKFSTSYLRHGVLNRTSMFSWAMDASDPSPSACRQLQDVTNRNQQGVQVAQNNRQKHVDPSSPPVGKATPHSDQYKEMQLAGGAALIAASCTPETARKRLSEMLHHEAGETAASLLLTYLTISWCQCCFASEHSCA